MESKKGRAAVMEGIKDKFSIREYLVPKLKENTILCKIDMCGVCGTDAHTFLGHFADVPFPLLLGHEISATIIKIGKGVEKDYSGKKIEVGDRITLVPAIHCKKCFYCSIAKTPSKCINMISYGFMNPEEEPHFTGGYADYLYLYHRDTEFFKIDAPAERVVFAEPLAIAIHAVERSNLQPGDTAVIIGSGAIGLLTLICARLSGATKTIMIGRRRKRRLELAKKFGADLTINMEEVPDLEERIKMIKEISTTGYGADVVFECAGAPAAFAEGIKYLRDCGTFCEVGHFTDAGSVEINPCKDILEKNITIEGIYDNEAEQFMRAVQILEKGEFPFESMISHSLPLTRLPEAIDVLNSGGDIDGKEVIKIVIAPKKG